MLTHYSRGGSSKKWSDKIKHMNIIRRHLTRFLNTRVEWRPPGAVGYFLLPKRLLCMLLGPDGGPAWTLILDSSEVHAALALALISQGALLCQRSVSIKFIGS